MSCRVDVPPFGPHPVVQASAIARILIASQAPGTRVRETGIPFAGALGGRLREWMNVPADEFYDESRVAIVPMALCYPGRLRRRGGSNGLRTCPTCG
jgi:uracil-DNA glycosylase